MTLSSFKTQNLCFPKEQQRKKKRAVCEGGWDKALSTHAHKHVHIHKYMQWVRTLRKTLILQASKHTQRHFHTYRSKSDPDRDGGPCGVKRSLQAESLLPGSWISDGEFKDAERKREGGGGGGEEEWKERSGEKRRGSRDLQCLSLFLDGVRKEEGKYRLTKKEKKPHRTQCR